MNIENDILGKKILVIEDEAHIAEGLRLNLTLAGLDVYIAPTGAEGLRLWREQNPDLIVLDIMLPGIDGFSVLQSIRLEDERLPVLILSARGDTEDKIRGLACGVDDYLAKPFNREEFLLRVKRLLTRSQWTRQTEAGGAMKSPEVPEVYVFGENRVDFTTRTAECRAGKVELSEQELKLLKLFFKNRGRPLSRKELLEVGWGYTGATTTRTVDNFLVRFRKYFEENPKKPVYFKSVRSLGYIFND